MIFLLAWLTGAFALGTTWGLVGWMLAHPTARLRSRRSRIAGAGCQGSLGVLPFAESAAGRG
jgi:hypothetical protein